MYITTAATAKQMLPMPFNCALFVYGSTNRTRQSSTSVAELGSSHGTRHGWHINGWQIRMCTPKCLCIGRANCNQCKQPVGTNTWECCISASFDEQTIRGDWFGFNSPLLWFIWHGLRLYVRNYMWGKQALYFTTLYLSLSVKDCHYGFRSHMICYSYGHIFMDLFNGPNKSISNYP